MTGNILPGVATSQEPRRRGARATGSALARVVRCCAGRAVPS